MGTRVGTFGASRLLLMLLVIAIHGVVGQNAGAQLEMFVEELPHIPKIHGYSIHHGKPMPANLTIGMYHKKWKFHRDLPETPVFVYGTSAAKATFPGPTIEALQGVSTYVTWENHLPHDHILPWDPTVPVAIAKKGGVPAVVHLHGGVHAPQSDGSALAWFTADFAENGPWWSTPTYEYPNVQHAGNLWYHDHALGLTRASLLAGLLAPYVILNPALEEPFMLPSGKQFDRHLVIADRSFNVDGSIFMNHTGNVPSVHPQWQPEYFGDAITVNGKAWPYLKVHRRRYRFRIINASNARYFRLTLSNGSKFIVVGSDNSYLRAPVSTNEIIMSPAEIYDVVVDFTRCAPGAEIILSNDARYPYPAGDVIPPESQLRTVMKFVVLHGGHHSKYHDDSKIPARLMSSLPLASTKEAVQKRYIVMYEDQLNGKPVRLYINGKRLEDPATETPKSGTTEVWEVINLTGDDHPLHLHLAYFQAVQSRELIDFLTFQECMTRQNDAIKCNVDAHAVGKLKTVPQYERTWKNVVKIKPGYKTTVVVKFNLVDGDAPYPFDATAKPDYVYHCHILDHEDNAMIRPLKLV